MGRHARGDVQDVITEAGLGKVVARHAYSPGILTAAAVFLGGFGLLPLIGGAPVIGLCFWGVAAVLAACSVLVSRNSVVYVTDGGIVVVSMRRRIRVRRWQHIREHHLQHATVHQTGGSSRRLELSITTSLDRRALTFTSVFLPTVAQLAEDIRSGLARDQLHALLASGAVLRFGPFTVGPDRFSHEGAGTVTEVAWPDVIGVWTSATTIVIRIATPDGTADLQDSTSLVPELPVFLEVLHARQGPRAAS